MSLQDDCPGVEPWFDEGDTGRLGMLEPGTESGELKLGASFCGDGVIGMAMPGGRTPFAGLIGNWPGLLCGVCSANCGNLSLPKSTPFMPLAPFDGTVNGAARSMPLG